MTLAITLCEGSWFVGIPNLVPGNVKYKLGPSVYLCCLSVELCSQKPVRCLGPKVARSVGETGALGPSGPLSHSLTVEAIASHGRWCSYSEVVCKLHFNHYTSRAELSVNHRY